MERIGVRELRQRASEWLRRCAAGESFEVTMRGRPVARLLPAEPEEGMAALVAAGRLRLGRGRVEDSEPPPAGEGPTASDLLQEARADER